MLRILKIRINSLLPRAAGKWVILFTPRHDFIHCLGLRRQVQVQVAPYRCLNIHAPIGPPRGYCGVHVRPGPPFLPKGLPLIRSNHMVEMPIVRICCALRVVWPRPT